MFNYNSSSTAPKFHSSALNNLKGDKSVAVARWPEIYDSPLMSEEEMLTGITVPPNEPYVGNYSAIGFDTLCLKFPITIPDHLLLSPWEQRTKRDDKNLKTWYNCTTYINEAKIFMRYYQADHKGNPLLVIEISSLPQLLYGNNLIALNDMGEAADRLNPIFSKLLPGTEINMGQGIPKRVDIFCDYYVGENARIYLNAISKCYLPRKDRWVTTNGQPRKGSLGNGISFKGNGSECCIYDQEEKRDIPGVIRLETRLKDTNGIADITGISRPTLLDLTPNVAFRALKRDLEQLGLWNTSIMGENLALATLMQHYPRRKAHHLFYIVSSISANPTMSKKKLAAYLGIGKRSFSYYLSDIVAAGVTPGMVEENVVLPPLMPQQPSIEVCKIIPKVPSDTSEDLLSHGEDRIQLFDQVIK